MGKQKGCMCCRKDDNWEWDDTKMFDFDTPVGKRVWPAICPGCREELETKYKTGEISRSELLIEFSIISGRICLKCAVSSSQVTYQLKDFTPKRRGKNDPLGDWLTEGKKPKPDSP